MPNLHGDRSTTTGQMTRHVRVLLAMTCALATSTAGAAALEGFETPALPNATHQYHPTGSGWTFTGTTGAGLQRNGSGFNAPVAPQGVQTAFLKSNDGSVTRSVTLAPGVYKVSFWAARRVSSTLTNPVQVWLNGVAVGTPLTPTSSAFARYTTTTTVNVPTHGNYTLKLSTTRPGEYTTLVDAVTVDLVNPFDALYGSTFQLPTVADDPIPAVSKPAAKAVSLNTPSYIDPVYGTRVYRATAATDHPGSSFVRHEYSRRQAFNANNTRFLAQSSNGFWRLYDANTFQTLSRTGTGGALPGMAGDCEPIWHPTDPTKIWYTSMFGGLTWYEQNVETGAVTTLADFTSSVRALWPAAARVWTKGEGTTSADGRYFAFMVESDQFATLGLITWDRVTKQIVGTLSASAFNGLRPDHISVSPSGKYVVPSWVNEDLGTRAYPLNFATPWTQLLKRSEHSDLAIGPDGQDYLVFTDYRSEHNQIRAMDLSNGSSFDLMSLRPRAGSQYAAHISGKAFDKPGWVIVSTYGDYASGMVYPDHKLEPMYRKVMLIELKPGGKKLSVAHTRAAELYSFGPRTVENQASYFGEHQATVSRDGSRVAFATNFNDFGAPSGYLVGLPSWVYTPSVGSGTVTPPPPGSGPLTLTLGAVNRNGYSGSFTLTSSVAAQCRIGSQPGQPYGALYDNMTASANGLSHSKSVSFGTTGPQTVYAVCQANSSTEQKEQTVNFP